MGGPIRPSGPLQWTPAGWFPKDNSHKVTSTIRELPEPEVIPFGSSNKEYPDLDADRNKLNMLKQNKGMMDFEVGKICRKFRIFNLDKDNLDQYPDEARTKLTTAIQCANAAEKTLNDFKEFLADEKYKKFNDEQKARQEEQLKLMIGETPEGVPHKKPEDREDEAEEEEEAAE